MRAHDVWILAADGTHDDEGETARVDRVARRYARGEGLEDGLGGIEALLARGREEVLAGCEDAVV